MQRLPLSGGARSITAVLVDCERERVDVLRVPGPEVRRGLDIVRTPQWLPANGAVATLSDGEHLVGAHREILRVVSDVVAPVPDAERSMFALADPLPSWARVVQRAGDYARMNNGVVFVVPPREGELPHVASRDTARDVASYGAWVCVLRTNDRVACAVNSAWDRDQVLAALRRQTPRFEWFDVAVLANYEAVQLVLAYGVVCVRDRRGDVHCARLIPGRSGGAGRLRLSGLAPRAASVAISRDDLCVLDDDRRLRCVHGPQDDAAYPLLASNLQLHDAMEGVTAVGLADGLGCALHGEHLACWGALARAGWVSARDRPVRVDGVRGVTALASRRGLMCSLSDNMTGDGAVACWGFGRLGHSHPRPVRVPLQGHVTGLFANGEGLCAVDDAGSRQCWDDVGREGPSPDGSDLPDDWERGWPSGNTLLAHAPDVVVGPSWNHCALTREHRVLCGSDALGSASRTVDGLEDVEQLAVTEADLFCALRRGGDVWCWGDNKSGALTATEAEHSPRIVTLQR